METCMHISYRWYHNHMPICSNISITLQRGEVYMLSSNLENINYSTNSPYTLSYMIEHYEKEYCHNKDHRSFGSPYPWFGVPKRLCVTDPNNKLSKPCRNCIHCRIVKNKSSYKSKKDQVRLSNESLERRGEFGYCKGRYHNDKVSPYPRDGVPFQLHLKNPDDKLSRPVGTCLHCRLYKRSLRKNISEQQNMIRE
jgi:hypothetical protein